MLPNNTMQSQWTNAKSNKKNKPGSSIQATLPCWCIRYLGQFRIVGRNTRKGRMWRYLRRSRKQDLFKTAESLTYWLFSVQLTVNFKTHPVDSTISFTIRGISSNLLNNPTFLFQLLYLQMRSTSTGITLMCIIAINALLLYTYRKLDSEGNSIFTFVEDMIIALSSECLLVSSAWWILVVFNLVLTSGL